MLPSIPIGRARWPSSYPNASVALLVNTGMYQFQSSDDPATVLAWYKSHVSAAAWTQDATVATNWNTHVGGVQISIAPPEAAGSSGVKTMIMISKD